MELEDLQKHLTDFISNCSTIEEQIQCINAIRKTIHSLSPFRNNPVDFVEWVKPDILSANDYNPNTVAPPEMKLLELSISNDGYTQPIVAWKKDDEEYEVVDGFHRNIVGRNCESIKDVTLGYLPVTTINETRIDKSDRIASTIRHNRARGKHGVNAMSEIVLELKRRNWSDKKIGKELGMDQDEVLRLTQISGLAEMFADKEFSEAWEADMLNQEDFDGDVEAIN